MTSMTEKKSQEDEPER